MPLRAIDLYSGIGGWSLGLRAAGIDVVGSYEVWSEAVATYNANLFTRRKTADVRSLVLKDLPQKIDLVVGSPPCTEFSFSNRGGGGNLAEGFKDVVQFLRIVRYLKPRFWLLENVPRLAPLLEQGFRTVGHPLYPYRRLRPDIRVVDFSTFGLPQSRRRCIAGRFPFELLNSYAALVETRTLGHVIQALAPKRVVKDPIWGIVLSRKSVTETEPEPPLDAEQLRMNREAKQYHPVYNDMAFPDRLKSPSRTVTATCTRVSRESIVVRDGDGALRRLTVRERASLQGFPITYQFHANSHSKKVEMIGNALPPVFSFFAGMAARRATLAGVSKRLHNLNKFATPLRKVPSGPITPPHSVAEKYGKNRRFRAALPGLRFKSGMRFELANNVEADAVQWEISFFYGSSKDIKSVSLDQFLYASLRQNRTLHPQWSAIDRVLARIAVHMQCISSQDLQDVWTRRSKGMGPYELVDLLGTCAFEMINSLAALPGQSASGIVHQICGVSTGQEAKLQKYSTELLAGFLIGSYFNHMTCAIGARQPGTILDASPEIDDETCSTVEKHLPASTWTVDPETLASRRATC